MKYCLITKNGRKSIVNWTKDRLITELKTKKYIKAESGKVKNNKRMEIVFPKNWK